MKRQVNLKRVLMEVFGGVIILVKCVRNPLLVEILHLKERCL